ncbi:MAG: DinB family protein [Victivallales bacterium]|nr:DinB family protein [Victivallales bacterium]
MPAITEATMAYLPVEHSTQNAGFADSLMIGLDEATASLAEALAGLDDRHVAAFPVPGEGNVAWIVKHCLGNLGWFGCACLGGPMPVEPEERWGSTPPQEGPFPTADELRTELAQVREALLDNMAQVGDEQLRQPPSRPNQSKTTQADCCIRAIWHTGCHVRQVWLLRGALGLADLAWPRQHWS